MAIYISDAGAACMQKSCMQALMLLLLMWGCILCRIRDLNDEINKLIREKGHWEKRIVELGGPDYAKNAPKVQDSQGFEIQGATGKGSGYRWASIVGITHVLAGEGRVV